MYLGKDKKTSLQYLLALKLLVIDTLPYLGQVR